MANKIVEQLRTIYNNGNNIEDTTKRMVIAICEDLGTTEKALWEDYLTVVKEEYELDSETTTEEVIRCRSYEDYIKSVYIFS